MKYDWVVEFKQGELAEKKCKKCRKSARFTASANGKYHYFCKKHKPKT